MGARQSSPGKFGMRCFVTGGAGFIGSTLVDRLLSEGSEVVAYDNLSTGFPEFLEAAGASPAFRFVEGDILDEAALTQAMKGVDIVYHLSANADIREGMKSPRRDLDQNTIGTFNVLEAMRANGCSQIAFASSSAVYGDAAVVPTPENVAMPVPISLYGASKLAGEGLISSYCGAFGFKAWIFRFVSVLGRRYTHGHVFDFVKQLRQDPSQLRVLGDGLQRKSYMDVRDCVDGIRLAVEKAPDACNIFNLGNDNYINVNRSVELITGRMGISPQLNYTGGARGWVGDSPFIWLNPSRIKQLGWTPKTPIEEAVVETVDWLVGNNWALTRR